MRGLDFLLSKTSDIAIPEGIDKNEDDIGLFNGRLLAHLLGRRLARTDEKEASQNLETPDIPKVMVHLVTLLARNLFDRLHTFHDQVAFPLPVPNI